MDRLVLDAAEAGHGFIPSVARLRTNACYSYVNSRLPVYIICA